jgi:hypothetical protein
MAIGPTEYAPEVQAIVESTGAQVVFLLVLGGSRGNGVSAQSPGAMLPELAKQLRHVAKNMGKDYARWVREQGS